MRDLFCLRECQLSKIKPFFPMPHDNGSVGADTQPDMTVAVQTPFSRLY